MLSAKPYTVQINRQAHDGRYYHVGYVTKETNVFLAVERCYNLVEAETHARLRNLELSGANARRGDRVLNLTTGQHGTCGWPSQSGRINVRWDGGGTRLAERWNIRMLIRSR